MLQVLVVQQESASWLMDAVRSIFWFLAKGVLLLLDGMFLIIDDIWKFKFFDNPYVNKIYSSAIIVACTWLCRSARADPWAGMNHRRQSRVSGSTGKY